MKKDAMNLIWVCMLGILVGSFIFLLYMSISLEMKNDRLYEDALKSLDALEHTIDSLNLIRR